MRRILIAEDNPLIALAMATTLERAGYTVVGPAAANRPALQAARGALPDLALVDIDLQGGDCGFDLADSLHAELGVPILFATGQLAEVTTANRSRALRCEALGALGKPFRMKALLAAVEQGLVFARGGAAPEAGRQTVWFGRP